MADDYLRVDELAHTRLFDKSALAFIADISFKYIHNFTDIFL